MSFISIFAGQVVPQMQMQMDMEIASLVGLVGLVGVGYLVDVHGHDYKLWNRRVLMSRLMYFVMMHINALLGIYRLCQVYPHYASIALQTFYSIMSKIGVTAGMHRLWTHQSYEASQALQYILLYFATCSQELSVIDWVKWHRVHHKHSDTKADPHNINDGFWFAHVGWLITEQLPEVTEATKHVNYDDIVNRKDMLFQQRYYFPLLLVSSLFIPMMIASIWNDTISSYWLYYIRTVFVLNCTFLVNSAAHTWGWRPFSPRIKSAENRIVSILTCGEGWHNYHHTYSKDYRASDNIWDTNLTGLFITLMAHMGLVRNRKVAKGHYHGCLHKKKEIVINNKSYWIL